jgi:hypothetical protein
MATAYRYTGTDAREYPSLGFRVEPGDVLYLDGTPPDSTFVRVDPGSMETGEDVPEVGVDWRSNTFPTSSPALKQPNKAASQAVWVEYANADGSFEEATGQAPEEATRRAIVEHYSADPEPEATEPVTEPAAEPVVDDDDTAKEV